MERCGECDKAPVEHRFPDGTGVCHPCLRRLRRETAGFPECPGCHHRYWLMYLRWWGYRCFNCGLKFPGEAPYSYVS